MCVDEICVSLHIISMKNGPFIVVAHYNYCYKAF